MPRNPVPIGTENFFGRYWQIKTLEGWKLKARYLMELFLGRKLSRSEEISYVDGDTRNCVLSNLILQRSRGGFPSSIIVCSRCKKTNIRYKSSYSCQSGIYICQECRLIPEEVKLEIVNLWKGGFSPWKIAKIITGVSQGGAAYIIEKYKKGGIDAILGN